MRGHNSKKPKSENHIDKASFLHGIDVYGDVDGAGSRKTMSVKFNYLEEAEKLRMEDMKTIKFWMYRDDALAFAAAITQAAMRAIHEDVENEIG